MPSISMFTKKSTVSIKTALTKQQKAFPFLPFQFAHFVLGLFFFL